MVASLPELFGSPTGWMLRMARRFGPVFALPMQDPPTLLVSDPEVAWDVLTAPARCVSKDTVQYRGLAALTLGGLLSSDGSEWQLGRKAANASFAPRVVTGFAEPAAEATRGFVDAAPTGVPINVDVALMRCTMRIVAQTLFGGALAGRGDEIVRHVERALPLVVKRAQFPLPSWAPVPSVKRFNVARDVLHSACDEVLSEVLALEPTARPATYLTDVADMVSSGEMTCEQGSAEIATMIVAGHETVASALTWTLGLLARNESWQATLREAVASRDASAGPMVKATLAESLRMYPPAWVISRKVTEDWRLRDIDVPAGSVVVVSPYVMGRSAALFHRPDEFVPQRFSAGVPAAVRKAFVPFGAGTRQCIGKEAAWVEMEAMLPELVRSSSWEVADDAEPMPSVSAEVTLRPKGGMWLVRREEKADV